VLEDESRRIEAGMDDYLPKPVQLRQLQSVLRKWLAQPAPHTDHPSPAAPPAPGAVALDTNILKRQIGDDASLIEELLRDYRRALLADVERLRTAFTLQDWQRIAALAHRMKSSSRAVGAVRMGACCADLELAGKAGDGAAVTRMMRMFESALVDVIAELEAGQEFVLGH
jgi:HPt (histidine-containing phosphotransfer) domain-containing protein